MTRPSNKPGTSGDLKSISIPQGMKAITLPEDMKVQGEMRLRAFENAADKKHRHRMEVREFWVKQAPVHITAIGIVVCTGAVALHLVVRPGSSTDDKKWAVSVLSYLLVAEGGFAFGKFAK